MNLSYVITKLINLYKKYPIWIIFFLLSICLSIILAFIPFRTQYVFGYDQARDAFEAYAIWHNHDIKILGPGTDLPGVFHGAFWYYAIAIPYAMGAGDPFFTGVVYFILLFFTVPLCYYVTYRIFKNIYIAIVASVLYAFSPLYQAFTRWFSNPVMSLFVMPFLLLCMWNYINRPNKRTSFYLGVCFALIIHSDFGFAMFLFLLPIYFLAFRLKFRFSDLLSFSAAFLIFMITFIAAELKFNFQTIKSVIHFFSDPHTTSSSIVKVLQAIVDKFLQLLNLTIFPFPGYLVAILLFLGSVLIFRNIHRKDLKPFIFLLIWLFNIVLFRIFNTGLTSSTFIFAPSLIPIAMFGAFFIFYSFKNKYLVLFATILIVVGQIGVIETYWKKDKTALSVQQGISFSKEKEIIQYTYEQAEKKPFSINTVTNPLYVNTLWAYLYEFYGKKQYGYLPFWHGRGQEGYLGNLQNKPYDTEYRYLIIEPTAGMEEIYVTIAKYKEDLISDLVEERNFGNFVVQKRKIHPNKPMIATPSALINSNLLDK